MKIDLNPCFHQPIRTQIMASVLRLPDVDFTHLKKLLHLSDGHLSTHLKVLIKAGYLDATKAFVNHKPRTTYRVTPHGKEDFATYLENLRKLF